MDEISTPLFLAVVFGFITSIFLFCAIHAKIEYDEWETLPLCFVGYFSIMTIICLIWHIFS